MADVLAVASRLQRPLLVGHSMGGVNEIRRSRGLDWSGTAEDWVTGEEARGKLEEADVAVEWLDTGHYLHWDAPDEVCRLIEVLACGS